MSIRLKSYKEGVSPMSVSKFAVAIALFLTTVTIKHQVLDGNSHTASAWDYTLEVSIVEDAAALYPEQQFFE